MIFYLFRKIFVGETCYLGCLNNADLDSELKRLRKLEKENQ